MKRPASSSTTPSAEVAETPPTKFTNREGDQVEVTVKKIDGAKTIVDLVKE